jgi:hypothetical protein
MSRAEALTRLMIAYGDEHHNASTLHLDGSLCPLQQLITDLAAATRTQLERTTINRQLQTSAKL